MKVEFGWQLGSAAAHAHRAREAHQPADLAPPLSAMLPSTVMQELDAPNINDAAWRIEEAAGRIEDLLQRVFFVFGTPS